MEIIVKHEKVRIVKVHGLCEVQEKNWNGDWERIWYGGRYFTLNKQVLDEFKETVLKYIVS